MGPDEERLRADLGGARFKIGAHRGKWALEELRFPLMFIRIATPPRPGSPDWLLLNLNCEGYPAQGPTAQLWDGRTDTALPQPLRPHDAAGVMIEFKDWSCCLYHPIDRKARTHWDLGLHPDQLWRPDSDITHFLETVHAILDHPSYLGASAPAEAAFMPKTDVA